MEITGANWLTGTQIGGGRVGKRAGHESRLNQSLPFQPPPDLLVRDKSVWRTEWAALEADGDGPQGLCTRGTLVQKGLTGINYDTNHEWPVFILPVRGEKIPYISLHASAPPSYKTQLFQIALNKVWMHYKSPLLMMERHFNAINATGECHLCAWMTKRLTVEGLVEALQADKAFILSACLKEFHFKVTCVCEWRVHFTFQFHRCQLFKHFAWNCSLNILTETLYPILSLIDEVDQ